MNQQLRRYLRRHAIPDFFFPFRHLTIKQSVGGLERDSSGVLSGGYWVAADVVGSSLRCPWVTGGGGGVLGIGDPWVSVR
jgi:hypothetical protein